MLRAITTNTAAAVAAAVAAADAAAVYTAYAGIGKFVYIIIVINFGTKCYLWKCFIDW